MSSPLHICIVYDRLYPASIGGAERWYRLLATRLAHEGHRVTYLTTNHWDGESPPVIPGVRIIPCGSQGSIYAGGRRRHAPLLRFAAAVGWHLFRHGGAYDVVQTSAMSPWAALASVAGSRFHGNRAILDWWEVWSWRYWREYLGSILGTAGWLAQWLVARSAHQPIAYSKLHQSRLRRLRGKGSIPHLRGISAACPGPDIPSPADPLILFVGRQIPEKQVPAIAPALAIVRGTLPSIRAILFGDGPDAPNIRRSVSALGLEEVISLPGFVDDDQLRDTLRRALCLILLSRREGFGLVIVEAASLGIPSVVLQHDDSAAAELIVDGVNGVLCSSTDAAEVASAILRVHDAGDELRLSTLAWYRANVNELTIEDSLPRLLDIYRGNLTVRRSVECPSESR